MKRHVGEAFERMIDETARISETPLDPRLIFNMRVWFFQGYHRCMHDTLIRIPQKYQQDNPQLKEFIEKLNQEFEEEKMEVRARVLGVFTA